VIGEAELGLRSMEREDGLEEAVLQLIEETQNGGAAGGERRAGTGAARGTAAEGGADSPAPAAASEDPDHEGGD
jgi:hypothetical protein